MSRATGVLSLATITLLTASVVVYRAMADELPCWKVSCGKVYTCNLAAVCDGTWVCSTNYANQIGETLEYAANIVATSDCPPPP
ncbi:MAG: hypothetical protein U1D55_03585 [Phycisphaerae bacterium]